MPAPDPLTAIRSPHRHPAQLGALVVGIAYLGIGIVGFTVTGLDDWVVDTREALLGFDLNGFHNLVHLGIGGILVAGALAPHPAITQGVLLGGGAVYLVAAVVGFLGYLDQLLSIDGSAAADNYLHAVSGTLAIAIGLLGGEVRHPRIELP